MSVVALILATLTQDGTESAKAALEKLAERFKDVRTLTCKVTQHRTTLLLKEPITSSGSMAYRRSPGRLVFRMERPRRTEIHLDQTTYQVYRPEEKRLERLEFPDGEVASHLLMVFEPKPDEIGKQFAIKGGTSDQGKIAIVLEPTDPRIRRRLTQLTLVVSEDDATLHRISYTDPDGDRIRFDLKELKTNPETPADTFRLDIPPGTRILHQKAAPGK